MGDQRMKKLKRMIDMYEESKEMKLIRDVRDKHYEETKGMNSKQLLNFYKQRAAKLNSYVKGSQKTLSQ
jgi:hypothetical protein